MKPLLLALHVIPGASRNEIVGWVPAIGGHALKIKVAAPPEDGKANKALLAFLAKSWDVPGQALSVVSGEATRHKRLKITGLENIQRVTMALPGPGGH